MLSKTLASIIFLLSAITSAGSATNPQQVIVGNQRKVFPSAGCTAPTIDHRWPAYNVANTCGTGSCTNGAAMNAWSDIVGSAASQSDNAVATYATNELNSLPGIKFNTGDDFIILSGTGITVPSTTTVYAVVKPASTSGVLPIFGASSGSNSIEYRIENGHQEIVNAGIAILATGSATIPTTSYSLIKAVVVNGVSVTLYTCSSGSCSVDGTPASIGSQTFSNPMNRIGTSGGDALFTGSMVEVGFGSGTVTGIETFVFCKYSL